MRVDKENNVATFGPGEWSKFYRSQGNFKEIGIELRASETLRGLYRYLDIQRQGADYRGPGH